MHTIFNSTETEFQKKEFLLLIFEGLPLCTRNGILGNIFSIQNDFFRYEKCKFLTIKCYGDLFGDFLVHAGNHTKIQQMAPKNHKADSRHLQFA